MDVAYCIGCGICVTACKQENHLPPDTDDMPGVPAVAWNQVLSISEGAYPDLQVQYFPVQCMHCLKPPCVEACSKNAISKREDGLVIIDESKCIACERQPSQIKPCMAACPYGAIQFNRKTGTAEACTFCAHRLDVGLEPACVRACLTRCLIFGDLNNTNSEVARKVKQAHGRVFRLDPEKECEPSILYINPEGVNLDKTDPLSKGKPVFGYKSNYVKPTI